MLHPKIFIPILFQFSFLKLIVLIIITVFCLGMGSRKGQSPLSIEDLYEHCGLPRPCNGAVAWEGQEVRVWGWLDAANVFDRQRYPHLAYEKFLLRDDQGRSLEIWSAGEDNRSVFAKLNRRASDRIVVAGRLVSVKMPLGTTCRLGVKVVIHHGDQIQITQ
ncbi:MAG: hypothetical protein VR64_21985 [Desulfatitalea sp. BRH_c12]|nr:MAG: hypothetical protein VR64_21985 [Desulfatitalea sp. BRH_c12]